MLTPRDKGSVKIAGSGPRRVAIFGSTGSIGVSALEVVRAHPDRFKIAALVAGGNSELLADQIKEFQPERAVIADETKYAALKSAAAGSACGVAAGRREAAELASAGGYDVMLAAIVGMAGLESVIAALTAGKLVALANKESVVAGGELLRKAQMKGGGVIVPVDSEHSAIFQALQGERYEDISGVTLTASGGPFLKTPAAELESVTAADAVKHPKWSMGAKISVDSATMFNKGHELIEAHWLFGIRPEAISVVVHPQCIIHSLLHLIDGSQLAQLSNPDMQGPIAYAMNYPEGRLADITPALDLLTAGALEFLPLDEERFPAVALARAALKQGKAAPAVYNLANEIAVREFLAGRIPFPGVSATVSGALERYGSLNYADLDDLKQIEAVLVRELIQEPRGATAGGL